MFRLTDFWSTLYIRGSLVPVRKDLEVGGHGLWTQPDGLRQPQLGRPKRLVMKAYGEVEVYLRAYLISAVGEIGWSASRSYLFTPEKRALYKICCI
jgi:hypothetical protein